MRRLLVPVLLVGCAVRAAEPADRDTPLPTLPYTPGLDSRFMDRSVDPCVDFYAYSCGGWQKLNPIPPDQSTWSVYGKLQDEIQRHLWGLLRTAADPAPGRTYCFSKEEVKQEFLKNPKANIAKAETAYAKVHRNRSSRSGAPPEAPPFAQPWRG